MTILPFPGRTAREHESGVDADDGARWSGLMLLAQDGDTEAYQRLLREIVPYLRAMARRYLAQAPAHEHEDAVQEVLLAVHGIRHTYERGRPFKPWLATIASRRLGDLDRRGSHRRRQQREALELLRLRELSLREASALSRQPEGALKVACHRALKSLRTLLDKKGHR